MSPARRSAAFDSFNESATVRIELRDSNPVIWRQVEVPTSITRPAECGWIADVRSEP